MGRHKDLILFLIIIFILAIVQGCSSGSIKTNRMNKNLSIGRMRVAIWPEYDDPGILVIMDGRFANTRSFPTKTSFLIPKGAVISDACSLSPGGQHFCQLFKIVNREKFDEVEMKLPFPNFYLSFHLSPFDIQNNRRDFVYKIKTNHPVKTLVVDIQQPLRSREFNISSSTDGALDKKEFEQKGFKHFKYNFNNINKGEERAFNINYVKNDIKPSVDIKFSPMTGPRVWGSPYDTQRRIKTYVYVLFGTGIIGLIGIISILFVKRRNKQ